MDSSTPEQMWLLTVKMAAAAKKRGADAPLAFAPLRNAKSLLNEAKMDEHAHGELVTRAQSLIDEAQREVFLASAFLGDAFEKAWTARVKKVMNGETVGEFPFSGVRFYPDMPRKEGWVRVALGDSLSMEKVRELASAHNIECNFDGMKHAVLTGGKASLKKALKAISTHYSGA